MGDPDQRMEETKDEFKPTRQTIRGAHDGLDGHFEIPLISCFCGLSDLLVAVL